MTRTTPVGIKSFGAYVPRRRISRSTIAAAHNWCFQTLKRLASGERSMCNWDEDAITMAVEAGRDCLWAESSDAISSLTVASTTAPYANLSNALIVSSALAMPRTAVTAEFGGSMRCGLTAVINALGSSIEGDHLVIASEKRTGKPGSLQEMQNGCAAAAVVVGQTDGMIAKFLGAETLSVPFIASFRKVDQRFDYSWEERWIRDEGVGKNVPEAVNRLLTRLSLTIHDVALFGMAGGPVGGDSIVAKMLGIASDRLLPDLQAQIGDTGAAHAMLLLISALERANAGDVIVVTSFGEGCEVVAFQMVKTGFAHRIGLAGSIANRLEETAYLKLLSFDGHIQLDWGMRAEADAKTALTELYRSADQILGFVGGKCERCAAVQFPSLPACVNCGALQSQRPFALANEAASVATYTTDWLMYTPSPPLYVGLVQFDVGARILMEIVDVFASGIEVGTPLKMMFRIKERDPIRHFDRYFWKAVPSA